VTRFPLFRRDPRRAPFVAYIHTIPSERLFGDPANTCPYAEQRQTSACGNPSDVQLSIIHADGTVTLTAAIVASDPHGRPIGIDVHVHESSAGDRASVQVLCRHHQDNGLALTAALTRKQAAKHHRSSTTWALLRTLLSNKASLDRPSALDNKRDPAAARAFCRTVRRRRECPYAERVRAGRLRISTEPRSHRPSPTPTSRKREIIERGPARRDARCDHLFSRSRPSVNRELPTIGPLSREVRELADESALGASVERKIENGSLARITIFDASKTTTTVPELLALPGTGNSDRESAGHRR